MGVIVPLCDAQRGRAQEGNKSFLVVLGELMPFLVTPAMEGRREGAREREWEREGVRGGCVVRV